MIDPSEHRLGISVQTPPAAAPDTLYRLATCAHHPEWGYQAQAGDELDQAIASHVQEHAAADQYVQPTSGVHPAVVAQVRQGGTFTVEQALRMEAARMMFTTPSLRIRGEDNFVETLHELDALAAWIIDQTLPPRPAVSAPAAAPTAPSLDEVDPDEAFRARTQVDG